MGAFYRLSIAMRTQLKSAALDLKNMPPRRECIAMDRALAGKDRLLVRVRTDREGSMTVTRVEFQGEDEWYCVMKIADGRLDVRSSCSGYFLKRAGAMDIARWLSGKADFVRGRKFRSRLEGECGITAKD